MVIARRVANLKKKSIDKRGFREEFEDTNGLIRILESKKDRQHNGQKKKRTKNDIQNITHKIKDRVTRTPLKTEGELR